MSSVAATQAEHEPATRTADLHLLGRMGRFFKDDWRLMLLALVLYPVDAIAVVVPPYLVQRILDDVIPNHDGRLLYILVAGYIAALVLERSPKLTPAQLAAVIRKTARPLSPAPLAQVDACAAVASVAGDARCG